MNTPSVGLLMMVKNEERVIGRALASARDFVSEIVVVDTGSTDGTVAIAERMGARVLHHPWADDYSAPRNAGIEAMTTDWVLHLDADEVLDARSLGRLPELLSATDRWAYLVHIVTPSGMEAGAPPQHKMVSVRIFRRRPELRYQGVVHEVIPIEDPGRRAASQVVIFHLGPVEEPDSAGDRAARYARILQRALEDDPGNGYQWMQLGFELAKAGDEQGAVDAFIRCLEVADMNKVYIASVTSNLATLQMRMGRPGDALDTVGRGVRRFPDFPDLHCIAGDALMDLNRLADAERAFQTVLRIKGCPAEYGSAGEIVALRAQQGLSRIRSARRR